MGLDIALGVIVLVAGIRGWLRGFLLQAIQIAALIGCIYLADPIRDLARPYGREYFPGVKLELLDKLLWWSGAVISYVVTAGLALSTLKLYRRRHYLEGAEPNRGDQGAGFLLGAAKGGLLALFLVATVGRHAPQYIQSGGWIAEQIGRSRSIKLNNQYRPADQVWNSVPVQTIVGRVRQRGLWSETADEANTAEASESSVAAEDARPAPALPTALPPKALSIPPPRLDPRSATFLEDVDRAFAGELPEHSSR